jgi:hypothetical protein
MDFEPRGFIVGRTASLSANIVVLLAALAAFVQWRRSRSVPPTDAALSDAGT